MESLNVHARVIRTDPAILLSDDHRLAGLGTEQLAARLLAATHLADAGFPRVTNLTGGILRWQADVDPTLPRY